MRLTICLAISLLVACDGGRKASDASLDVAVADTGSGDTGNDGGARDSGASDSEIDSDGGLARTPAQLAVTPAQAFLQTTADTSVSLTVFVKNTGGLSTGPLLMTLTGSDASQFQIFQESCPTGLDPGRSCDVFLTFEPPSVSPDPNFGAQATASLVVADSGASGSVVTVDIGVTILVPSEILAILGPADMGTVPPGGGGANLPFIVVNTGTNESGPLQVSISSSQFGKTADACSGSILASAATCTFSIQFSPTALGVQRAILTVQGSAKHGVASEIIAGTCVAQ